MVARKATDKRVELKFGGVLHRLTLKRRAPVEHFTYCLLIFICQKPVNVKVDPCRTVATREIHLLLGKVRVGYMWGVLELMKRFPSPTGAHLPTLSWASLSPD